MMFNFNNRFTGYEKIVRLLIHNGADNNVKNKQGKSANEIATEKGNLINRIGF